MRLAKLAFLFVIVLTQTASLRAQDNNRRDGNWWRDQNETTRISYMIGFLDGMELGRNFSYWKYVGQDQDTVGKVVSSYESYVKRFLTNVTVGQFTDGLNDFYSDFRNRQILISDGVWVVVNEIAGTPKDKIDGLKDNLRKASTSTKE